MNSKPYKRYAAAALIGMSALSLSRAAVAGDENDPRSHLERGYEEFQLGDFAEALALFETSYRMRPSARVLRAIAKCQFELRHYTRSIEFAERALREKEEALSPELEADTRALRERARAFVVDVNFDLWPADAVVVVDGQASSPSVRLDVGTHAVHVSAAGHTSMTSSIAVQSNSQTKWTFHLVPLGAASPAIAPERSSPLVPILVGGLALVGTGITAALWYDRNSAVISCNDSLAGCENIESLRGERTLAAVGTFVGGAVIVGSAYFLMKAIGPTQKGNLAQAR